MTFVEFPKWVRAPGHSDVLVNSAEEEAATLAKWSADDKPTNPLTAPRVVSVPAVLSVEKKVEAPDEPRPDQLAVTIPDDWRDLPFLPRKAGAPSLKSLAAKVSSTAITDKASAIAAIEGELIRREKGE